MRVLYVFADMFRPNRLNAVNSDARYNPMDAFFTQLGGTLYSNCYSPAPDTPRGMAAIYTGKTPAENGCDTRVKWPRHFLGKKQRSLFDGFLDAGYAISCFSNPNERELGLFPPRVNDDVRVQHNSNYQMGEYLRNIELKKDHFLFVSLPDFHWALTDYRYTGFAEKHANQQLLQSLNTIFTVFEKDTFDHIVIFSDHGFKFSAELKSEQAENFLNESRSKVLLFHRGSKNHKFNVNHSLLSSQDVFNFSQSILSCDQPRFEDFERNFVAIEDHKSIDGPKLNQNVDIWAVVTADQYYIRTLTSGYYFCGNKLAGPIINDKLDTILKKNTQFGKYSEEHSIVNRYRKLLLKQSTFMNGSRRKSWKKLNLIALYYFALDFLKIKSGKNL